MKKPELAPNSDFDYNEDGAALQKLFNDKLAMERLSLIDQEYPYWDIFKYKVKSLDHDPKFLWKVAKLSRRTSMTKIKISNIQGFEFTYNTISNILKNLHEFDLHLGGILEGSSIVPTGDKNRYLISSIMEEAIASSQLEGAVTTREEAKEMLRTERKPRNHSEKMILNNYLTIRRIVTLKNKELSPELIKEIHSLITKATLDDGQNEGRFRTNNNVNVVDPITNEIFYSPPDQTKIEELMKAFCDFANSKNDSGFIHPIVRAIIIHFLIGYIHPFVDGNGRTARAIFYWYLISQGYWLMEYLSISRIILKSSVQYANAYLHTEYDSNDLTYFIYYNLKSMDLALKSLKEYIHKKIDERKSLFQLISYTNLNERQAEIIKDVLVDTQRTFTIKEIQQLFDVVYQTARTDLLGLVENGYLKEKTIGRKSYFFRSDFFEEKIKKISTL